MAIPKIVSPKSDSKNNVPKIISLALGIFQNNVGTLHGAGELGPVDTALADRAAYGRVLNRDFFFLLSTVTVLTIPNKLVAAR